jgi:hypothetical protein
MRDAMNRGDMDQLLALTDHAAKHAPELARHLRELTDAFELQRIADILGAGR